MRNKKVVVIFFIYFFALAFGQATAQLKDSIKSVIVHAIAVDTRPNEPIRMFSMRLPFRVAPISGRYEVSVDYHLGNTWNPSGVLEYPDASEPYPAHPWEATYHPPYSSQPQRYQLYSADGVIRGSTFTYTKKITTQLEVFASLNTTMLVGGANVTDVLVSDRTIETFHKIIFHQQDPFRRLKNPLNKAEMKFTDRQGRTLEITPGKIYFGTVDVGYRQFFNLIRANKMFWSLNLEAQLGVPLNAAREFLSAGVIIGTAFTKQVAKNYGVTIAIGYSAQGDKIMRIRPENYDFNYSKAITGYRFLIGQSFDFTNGHRFTLGIEMQGMTSPLSTKTRVVAPYLNPEDIRIQSSYPPEYWTPDNPINITNQRRAAQGLIRGSEYVSINFSYRFGKPKSPRTVSFYLQEDWTVIYDTGGYVLPLFLESNNAQDFGVGVKLIQSVPWKTYSRD